MTPGIDVVIPTLNEAAGLALTIAPLRDVTRRVIVCDGGSTDDTQAIARDAGANVIASGPGRGRQLAAGAAASDAPWLLFLHADTVLGVGWRESVCRFVSDDSNSARAGYFSLRFASPDPRARRIERLAAWRCRTFGLPYGDQGLLMARAYYQRLGGFRPLPLMEDVDLVRRIGRRNLVALDAEAITSARRYERDGWLRRPLRNLACLVLYFAGLPAPLLQRLYR
ncbi:MAG TPA: TIGR04283 family arsenosugar biosynthesis glycosyltransferase [Reyranella sp.]|nr:TIGR04283 family arsenosugar biosynthesis glycosyltransferase [Reyranella sp.]